MDGELWWFMLCVSFEFRVKIDFFVLILIFWYVFFMIRGFVLYVLLMLLLFLFINFVFWNFLLVLYSMFDLDVDWKDCIFDDCVVDEIECIDLVFIIFDILFEVGWRLKIGEMYVELLVIVVLILLDEILI